MFGVVVLQLRHLINWNGFQPDTAHIQIELEMDLN